MADRETTDYGRYSLQVGVGGGEAAGGAREFPLYEDDQIDRAIVELLAMLERDGSAPYQAALTSDTARGIRQFSGHWFQRIDYPEKHLASTTERGLVCYDEGGLNTLNKRLTSDEASILRPWPKWLGYLKARIPDVRGKSVLELGASNGFFSFRFAEMGASRVTGVEIVPVQSKSATWSAGVLGHSNVTFLNTDFLLDHSIPQHDIVFLSEVHNHFLFPFVGLAKIVNLARELVVLDTGIIDVSEHRLRLDTAWQHSTGGLIYHSFMFSDGLLMDFLALLGVPPHRVTKFKAPVQEFHTLYMIDTSHIQEDRARMQYPPYLVDLVNMGRPPA